MEKISITQRDVFLLMVATAILLMVAVGFGYFFGRYHQMQLNTSALESIPDVNCGRNAKI